MSVDKPKIYNNLILPVIPNLIGDPFKILNFKEIDGFPIRSGMTKTKGFISLLTFSTLPKWWATREKELTHSVFYHIVQVQPF